MKGAGKYINDFDIYLFNTGEAQRAYLTFGCRYIPVEKAWRFVVWAPCADGVSVVGDFNGWDGAQSPMTKDESGVFYALLPGVKKGDRYKYEIHSGGRVFLKSDPFAFFSENGLSTASIAWDIEDYPWQDDAYIKARMERDIQKSPVSIYELHLGSWQKNGNEPASYRETAPRLAAYCREMGYTHIELMPLCEHPFDGSWGYQVTGYYAPTSRYGTPQDFMFFVDTMHQNGIGVIMDFVPAHFPKDAHGLARFDGTCLFENADSRLSEHPEWGTLIFDYEKPQVQSFLVSSAMLFFDKYHIDGIRTDAVSSMLYLDYGRKNGDFVRNKYGENINLGAVEFLRKLNSVILTNFKGCMTIAEESTAYPLVAYPPRDGGLGFTFKWDMGYMHDTLEYMSLDHLFRRDNHDKMTFSMMYAFSERFILAYSHDEVVHGKRSMIEKMFGTYDEKFSSLKALYGFTFAHPGKKLTFMGSEFGQFIEWDYKKELDFFLLKYPKHDSLRDFCRALNAAYKKYPAMYEIDGSWDGFSWLSVNNRDQSVFAFLRKGYSGKGVVCVCNFTPVKAEGVIIGLPEKGALKLVLNSDDARFGGSGAYVKKTAKSRARPFEGHPQSASLDLPPLSALYYEYKAEEDKRLDKK